MLFGHGLRYYTPTLGQSMRLVAVTEYYTAISRKISCENRHRISCCAAGLATPCRDCCEPRHNFSLHLPAKKATGFYK